MMKVRSITRATSWVLASTACHTPNSSPKVIWTSTMLTDAGSLLSTKVSISSNLTRRATSSIQMVLPQRIPPRLSTLLLSKSGTSALGRRTGASLKILLLVMPILRSGMTHSSLLLVNTVLLQSLSTTGSSLCLMEIYLPKSNVTPALSDLCTSILMIARPNQ